MFTKFDRLVDLHGVYKVARRVPYPTKPGLFAYTHLQTGRNPFPHTESEQAKPIYMEVDQ
eukprot:3027860-Rhodomonas_salina.2